MSRKNKFKVRGAPLPKGKDTGGEKKHTMEGLEKKKFTTKCKKWPKPGVGQKRFVRREILFGCRE